MNTVGIGLMILLVVGAFVGIWAAAGSQPQTPYVGTYGDVQSNQTNNTQVAVQQASGSAMGMGAYAGIFLALGFIVTPLAIFIFKKPTANYGRR